MNTSRIVRSVVVRGRCRQSTTAPAAFNTANTQCGSRSQSTSAAVATEPENQAAPKPTLPSQTARSYLVISLGAELSLRRFWKTVDVHQQEGGKIRFLIFFCPIQAVAMCVLSGQYSIRLDLRSLKTPSGKPLVLPKHKLVLATLIAREWDEQRKILKQHSLPMTSLASRAIDGLQGEEERQAVVDNLMNYLDTDTICFHESKPLVLAKMQKTHWEPLVEWLHSSYQVPLQIHHDSILFSKQSASTHAKLRSIVSHFDPLKLAAFERAVHASKSFVIALALVEGRLTVEQASDASRVEVLSQISRWGEVEDTHDVDHQEIRMKLGSVACALIDAPSPELSTTQ
ncbi:hypothetical protein VP01_807g10 [Puccinia sorghi]|uniref:ATP synthase mitochondrial F1 complex assembly factor 2 n=1 Tax=Puccinia sorghi TaxID=27349 RepID=A0A0L6UCF9_9BASI|nr:hypothetical protein VP01_807g10 [Puccinia sorghi]